MAIEKNALLVCDSFVDDKQPNKLMRESKTRGMQNHQLEKIENEMNYLKSFASETKTSITQNNIADP